MSNIGKNPLKVKISKKESLRTAIINKDQEARDVWLKKAQSGEPVRIM